MSELPKGWVETTIDRITSDVSYGVTAKSDPHQGDLRMLRITDIQNNKVDWETVPFCHYDSRFEKALLANEDIVVARTGATVGKSFLIENAIENSVYASYLIRLRVASYILPKYVAWFLHSPKYWKQIIEKQEGIGQPNVNGTKLKTLQLSLAPLAEQKRIVEKLDQVLAQVDTIKARLDGIPAILKRFRQSVLAAAVSGKLTEEWRGNHISSWQESCVGDVASVSTGKTPKRTESSYWDSPSVPWLTSSATGSLFCYKAEQYVSQFAVDNCKLKLFGKGTLLLAMYGEGKTRGQVTELTFDATCNQACAAITVKKEVALTSFVKLRLLENYEETRKAAAGGNQPNLNLNKVREIPINLPLIEEQTEIVRLVDQYFAFADTIEKQVQKAQQRVDKLTQSILAKAFRGEIVPQDPTDEPADQLLKRIATARAESEALAKAAKKVGKKK
ncbi:restriction endonuclease subunit S [Marinomonas sp.]|uniref:restriction endonuclease subunit S n=1 Tax=Marinomonas sp. TaxID=1904862 RepID=UPI003BA98269